jgi:hypothetical protein
MKKKTKVSKPARGKRLTTGRGWMVATTTGKQRMFRATLLHTFNLGKTRLAIFSVPK